MAESIRQKKVASLIQEALSSHLIRETQDSSLGMVTLTKVEMSKDLKTARVSVSLYNREQKNAILELLEEKKGFLRKVIASQTKLKYNPKLIFSLDESLDYEEKIDRLLSKIRKDER